MSLDFEIFKKTKFSDLLEQIHKNHKKKDRQIIELISDLKPYITNINDASVLVPIIKDYMEIGVKNDEQLIKMAAIVQRLISKTEGEGGSSILTDEEKEQLLQSMEEIASEVSSSIEKSEKQKEIEEGDETGSTEDNT